MKRFLTASAALALLALPPVLQAAGAATTNPYVARYSLDYYKNDPVPLTAIEIRRIEKAAALYQRTGKITILQPRVMPQSPAPVASGSAGSANCVPAGTGSAVAPLAAQAPAAVVGPTDLERRRQAKAEALYKRTGIRTVFRASTPTVAAPVVATVAAAAGVPCAPPPVLAALSPSPSNPLTDTIQSGSLLGTPGPAGSVTQAVVPEPGTLGLLGLGLLGLGLSRRKAARISR
jgi:hypothetical protein